MSAVDGPRVAGVAPGLPLMLAIPLSAVIVIVEALAKSTMNGAVPSGVGDRFSVGLAEVVIRVLAGVVCPRNRRREQRTAVDDRTVAGR